MTDAAHRRQPAAIATNTLYLPAGALALLTIALYEPELRRFFKFGQPDTVSLLAAILVDISSVVWFEVYK